MQRFATSWPIFHSQLNKENLLNTYKCLNWAFSEKSVALLNLVAAIRSKKLGEGNKRLENEVKVRNSCRSISHLRTSLGGRGSNNFRIMFLSVKLWKLNVLIITAHKIEVSENLEKYLLKGEGWESVEDVCDLWTLGRHCIRNRAVSVMEITAWAQRRVQMSEVHRSLWT